MKNMTKAEEKERLVKGKNMEGEAGQYEEK